MKDRIALYLLTFLALSGVFTLPACVYCPKLKPDVSTNQAKSLRFKDKTGRNIEIGMYGSVLNLCGTRPIREGYSIAYQNPKSPGKENVVYYSDKKLAYGLNQISLTSNVPAGAVELGQEVTITAVVETDDGLFQSTHEFRWTAGKDELEVTRNIKNKVSEAIGLRGFNVILTLNDKDFSRYEVEDIVAVLPPVCPPPPPTKRKNPKKSMRLKVLRPGALAADKSSDSAKGLLGELSHDYFLLPKQAGKYDVVFGLRGDSNMLKGQSLTLKYVYRLEPNMRE